MRRSTSLLITLTLLTGLTGVARAEHGDRPDMVPSAATTAVEIAIENSMAVYPVIDPESAPELVLVARHDAFADALAGAVVQGDHFAPLLLTPPDDLPDAVAEEITRLEPGGILILGGTNAVSEAVEAELRQLVPDVDRLSGGSRIETAVAIADHHDADAERPVIVVRAFGEGSAAYVDALAAGVWSAGALAGPQPIVLTETSRLSSATADFLRRRRPETVYVVGGRAAVSDAVVAEIDALAGSVTRVAGGDRNSTALAIAKAWLGADATIADSGGVYLVDSGRALAWADGFTAALLASLIGTPILLSSGDDIPAATADWLAGSPIPEETELSVWCGMTVRDNACHEAANMIAGAYGDGDGATY